MVRYVIIRETWLHYFGGIYDYYISDINFERLSAGDTTDSILETIFFTWCIFKLDCYVAFCHSCLIFIVANYIIHMGIQVVSWSCFCYITITSYFSDHIEEITYF